MPIHRVPGSRSVFAYTEDLDAWLAEGAEGSATGGRDDRQQSGTPRQGRVGFGLGLIGLATVAAVLVLWESFSAPEISRIETSNNHVIGYDLRGQIAWTFEHPQDRLFESEGQFSMVARPQAPQRVLRRLAHATSAAPGYRSPWYPVGRAS